MKVRKGTIETNVTERALKRYLDNGWVLVDEKAKETDKELDKFTKAQLMDIAKNRQVYVTDRMKKAEIIKKLQEPERKTSNTGFTDNLIKD